MSADDSTPIPTEINLHRKSKVLEVAFSDGSRFNFTCEYLRVLSPSAEVRGHGPGQGVLQLGKEDVNIEKIEQVGNYAVLLYFDDGHHTGIYSWETLFELGMHQARNWNAYLQQLQAAGHTRKERTH